MMLELKVLMQSQELFLVLVRNLIEGQPDKIISYGKLIFQVIKFCLRCMLIANLPSIQNCGHMYPWKSGHTIFHLKSV